MPRGVFGPPRFDTAQDLVMMRPNHAQDVSRQDRRCDQTFAQGAFGHSREDQVAALVVQRSVEQDFEVGPPAQVSGCNRRVERVDSAPRGQQVSIGRDGNAGDGMRLEQGGELEGVEQFHKRGGLW
jgi:hypothetical protein